MRLAGPQYIPREKGESDAGWLARVNRTILFNVYKRTLRYLGGRVFAHPVTLEEGTREEFLALAENVDRMGRNLTVWGRQDFESGLNDGVTFCVVDFNHVRTRATAGGVVQYQTPNGDWANKTEAVDAENGWAPYFVRVDAWQVLDARVEWRGGQPRITHFRYSENVTEPYGQYGYMEYQRIRVFYLDDAGKPAWE